MASLDPRKAFNTAVNYVTNPVIGTSQAIGGYIAPKVVGAVSSYFGGGGNNQNKIINTPPPTTGGGNSTVSALQKYVNDLQALNAAKSSISNYVEPPVYLPSVNLPQIYKNAQNSQAVKNVGSYYTSQLNQYLANASKSKQLAQESYTTNIKQYENALQKALEESQIQGQRTGEDVSSNLANIATDESARQTTEGRTFDAGIRGLREQLAETGLGAKGMGAQQIIEAKTARGEAETAQTRQVERAKTTQNLLKTRTMADLARSDEWKKKDTDTAKTMSRIDLDREMNKFAVEEQGKRNQLQNEQWERQQAAIDSELSQYFRNYIGGLKDSKQKEKATSLYGTYL